MLLFVVAENKQNPEWLELHQRQAASMADGGHGCLCGASTTFTKRRGEIAESVRK